MNAVVKIEQNAEKRLALLTSQLDESEVHAFKHILHWQKSARIKQKCPDGDWAVWLILAGRGWGKTRTGAEDIVSYAMRHPNVRCGVIAPTRQDLRRVCFEGTSGIIQSLPQKCYFGGDPSSYNRSAMEIRLWNDSIIQGYAAIEPNRLRGPQFHRIWADELAAWRYAEAYDQMMFGLRLGDKPQLIITTTPRPTTIIRSLVKRADQDVFLTQGNTFENFENLAETALEQLKARYEGTRLGRQELYAELLEDIEGALWSYRLLDGQRIPKSESPEMSRIVIAIDPAVTNTETSDETGIIVAGSGADGKYYVIDDLSGKMDATAWGRVAVEAFYKYQADRIVAEVNNGGDLVEKLLRSVDDRVPYTPVRASRGKITRAEPIAALYEQKKVFHVGGFKELEDQLCSYSPASKKSPDRLDALVWALTELSQSSGKAYWRIS